MSTRPVENDRDEAPATAHHLIAATTSTERLASDALVGGLAIAGTAGARIVIELFVGGIAPFILSFPAVMIATLLNGGRAGTIAALGCQLLTIRYVFPNWVSIHGGVTTDLANVVLSTIALGGMVWATASYRTASASLRSQCENQVHTLSLLISEMDHRTKNNFQIAAGLLAHQAMASFDPALARELDKAAVRLETIASVYKDLSMDGITRERIDLADYLERIVTLLRAGATPAHVAVTYRADHVTVPVQSAIIVGLIVNEWVTNALRHAFGDGPGRISVDLVHRSGHMEAVVQDDGGRAAPTASPGKGSELIGSLAKIVGGRISVERRNGTRCSLYLPGKFAAA